MLHGLFVLRKEEQVENSSLKSSLYKLFRGWEYALYKTFKQLKPLTN